VADPYELAHQISEARGRLLAFVAECSAEQWASEPMGSADPRSVSVIVDHVANSYEYLGSWMRAMVAGEAVEVNSDMVDELNAIHAKRATSLEQAEVIEHLGRSGDQMIEFVSGLTADQLAMGDGRVELFAQIAKRHADTHRSELEEALFL
jgi:uncharacterized damage-inducible protein DinB